MSVHTFKSGDMARVINSHCGLDGQIVTILSDFTEGVVIYNEARGVCTTISGYKTDQLLPANWLGVRRHRWAEPHQLQPLEPPADEETIYSEETIPMI